MNDSVDDVLCFDSFVLDKRCRTLKNGENSVALRPKSFDVLVELATQPGMPVSKTDLLDSVWPDAVVSDESLTRCISDIRQAIDDNDHRIIKTLPRLGYQFSIPVENGASSESPFTGSAITDGASSTPGEPSPTAQSPSVKSWRNLPNLRLLSVVLVLAAILLVAFTWMSTSPTGLKSVEPTVAVLPFANLSDNPAQAYFSEGITDDIAIGLSRFGSLVVISRNSTYQDAIKRLDAARTGQSLNARYVVTGNVRRDDDRLRISALLVDSSSGQQIWAENFDSKLAEVFEIQDRIVSNIVTSLVSRIGHAEIERNLRSSPRSLFAYDYYLRGKSAMREMRNYNRGGALAKARELYDQAVTTDSRYPLALQALANTYLLAWLEPSTDHPIGQEYQQQRTLDRAQALAQQAIELDATVAEAQATLGWILYWQRRNDQALAAFDRALQINPNLVDGRYAVLLVHSGRAPDAIEYAKRIMRLDPYYPPNYPYYLGKGYFFVGRYEEAFNLIEPASTRMPENRPALVLLVAVSALTERHEKAKEAAEELLRIQPDFSIDSWLDFLRMTDQGYIDRLSEGLLLAGLPK